MTLRDDLMHAAVGVVATALAAQVRVPLEHVPMTLQTLAMFVTAALGGVRVGVLCAAIYLLAAWLGAPVLSGWGTIGQLDVFAVKNAGYVVGFVPAACIVGRARRGPWWRLLAAALLAHAIVLAIGGAWLAAHVGVEAAWRHGVWPFVPGALLKSALVPPIVAALRRLRR